MPGQLAKGLKKIIFGHLFFSFSFDQKLWWIPHVTCRMSFLFFWPRTHNVCYICLALLSFLFSKSRICPCLVLSFLFFCSTLTFFPVLSVAFGFGFRQGSLCLAGWCFFLLLHYSEEFDCLSMLNNFFCIKVFSCLSILISGVSILKVCNFGKVANNQ